MRNFRYFFREGVGNMLSHGFMSFAAIGVTVAFLLIISVFIISNTIKLTWRAC